MRASEHCCLAVAALAAVAKPVRFGSHVRARAACAACLTSLFRFSVGDDDDDDDDDDVAEHDTFSLAHHLYALAADGVPGAAQDGAGSAERFVCFPALRQSSCAKKRNHNRSTTSTIALLRTIALLLPASHLKRQWRVAAQHTRVQQTFRVSPSQMFLGAAGQRLTHRHRRRVEARREHDSCVASGRVNARPRREQARNNTQHRRAQPVADRPHDRRVAATAASARQRYCSDTHCISETVDWHTYRGLCMIFLGAV